MNRFSIFNALSSLLLLVRSKSARADIAPGVAVALRAARDESGASAVEFAFILPVMLTIFLGGFQLSQALATYRKVTVTARTVADLTTQYAAMSASDVSTVLNASAQAMAPFPTSVLTIVLTQIGVSSSNQATVTWSKALNGTALTQGARTTLPAGVCQPGASVVLADVTYKYAPPFGNVVTGTITMRDTIYMSPRKVQSITYSGS